MKNWLLFICLLASLQLATSLTLIRCLSDCFSARCKEDCASLHKLKLLEDYPHETEDERLVELELLEDYPQPETEDERPVDCCDIQQNTINNKGTLKSGVYDIYPPTAENKAVKVYCDMDTEGGGWTVFLSRDRKLNKVNFTADWNAYKNGFGTPGEEHWLGNDILHALTQSKNRKNVLRLEYSGHTGSNTDVTNIFGEWNTFIVSSNAEKYRLTALNPSPKNSAAIITFEYHDGMKLTTFDEHNDNKIDGNCADLYKGGWWYNDCYKINPTGRHFYEDKTGIRAEPWAKEVNNLGYANTLQLKMRLPICDLSSN